MSLVDKFKQYPLVLWALALYLCSLGFNFKMDIPLAIFAMASVYAFANSTHKHSAKTILSRHWHLIVFLIATLIVTVTSKNIHHSLAVQVQLLPAMMIYLVIAEFVSERQRLYFVIGSIVLAGLIIGVGLIISALLQESPDPLEKMQLMNHPLFVAPNDVLFFSVISPLALYLLLMSERRQVKLMALVYLLITSWTVVYMQSRQAVGVLLVASGFFFLMLRPLYGVIVIVVCLFAVLCLDWLLGHGLSKKLIYLFPRRYVWDAAWQMFLDRPMFGQGPGMFRECYPDFLGKAGYILSQVEDRRPMNWAHSLYLEQLSERGLLGLLGLLILLLKPIKQIVSIVFKRIKTLSRNDILLAIALLASFAAFCLAGLAESSLLRLWVVSTLFALISVTNSFINILKE